MRISNPFSTLSIPQTEAMLGFEKEFSLRARAKADGTLYNLNLSVPLLKCAGSTLSSFSLIEEYSHCLLEVVSNPVPVIKALETLDALNKIHEELESLLVSLVESDYPELAQLYEVSIEDDGCSPTNLYLNSDLTITNDQSFAEKLVLPRYVDSVIGKKELLWSPVPGLQEKMIGVYNGIQSFHFTYNPSYDGIDDYQTYLTALVQCARLVEKFASVDTGATTLVRNGEVVQLPTLTRSIFLQELLRVGGTTAGGIFVQPALFKNPDTYLGEITTSLASAVPGRPLDSAFKEWPSFDMRPRILRDTLPAVEVRRFSSSFSTTQEIRALLQALIVPDTKVAPTYAN